MKLGEHVHRETRSGATTWGIVAIAVLLCVVSDVFQAPRFLLIAVAFAIVGASLLAAFVHARFGFASRAYQAANRVETIVWCFGSTLLVASGQTAATLAWLPYLATVFHGGRAAVYPRFNLVVFALAPLGVVVVFALRQAWHEVAVVLAITAGSLALHRALVRATRDFGELLARYTLDEERLRIARDLHDGLGAELNAMVWTARALQVRQPSAEAETVERGLMRSLDDLGSLVWAMREHEMGFEGFVAHIRGRVNELFVDHISIEVQVTGDDAALPNVVAVNATHVVLEAIRNAIAHSGGKRVIVTLALGEKLRVAVEDDGHGIDPLTRSMGHGMLHMHERALKAGAQLQVEALTPGTRVSVAFSPHAFTA